MNPFQNELKLMLKSKGTGKTMGKSLSDSELARLPHLLVSDEVSLVTKATLITALLALQPEPNEAVFIEQLHNSPSEFIPQEVQFLLGDLSKVPTKYLQFATAILPLVRGQSMSQGQCDLNFKQVFDPDMPPYYVASFLEALRLKEETAIENITCYHQLLEATHRIQSHCNTVVDLSVGYDGFTRTPFLSLFVAPVLAAIGVPTVTHGIFDIGPKHGITPAKILELAGYPLQQPLSAAQEKLENAAVGWTYVDQAQSCPTLFDMVETRNLMLKRPMLSTLEKLLLPIKGSKETIVVTSYTHPPYKAKMALLLEANPLITNYMVLRGLEGSIQLALDRKTPIVTPKHPSTADAYIRPEEFGLSNVAAPNSADITAEQSLNLGLSALSGESSWASVSIIYLAAAILSEMMGEDRESAVERVRASLLNGSALAHWQRGISV